VGRGIADVLTFAVGVAISPVPIIAVILMLFSRRARVNGPAFLLGWVLALVVVSGVAYIVADANDAATSDTTSDTISWAKLVLGVLFLALAARQWRRRPTPGVRPEMPSWMGGVDELTPAKALGLGILLAGFNPKNLFLTLGAATGLAQLGVSATDAVVSLTVFVVVGSVTIAGPVFYDLLGGEHARTVLDDLKEWLGVHNPAVMTVLFVVFGVDLVGKALPQLTN
jgi:Sap, sulfolipid-1-addressing protein